jgi:putative ABC transport system permease protein
LIGALAIIVSALGVYGLVAYTVKQQAQAIGVRTALGAPRLMIVRQYVEAGAWLAAIGTVIGILIALALGRLMSTLLFGVPATDIASFAGATLVVVASTLFASMIPAWRAVVQDPIAALRRQ